MNKFTANDFELRNNGDWFTLKRKYNDYASSVTDIKSVEELYDLQYVVNCMIRNLERKLP